MPCCANIQYLVGADGTFVHAPSSNGVVRVERYTSGYWVDRWVGARRVSSS